MDKRQDGIEDFCDEDGENWLHAEGVACPNCNQWLFRIDQSPLDNTSHLYCDRCPVRIDVVPYGPVYEQIEQSLPPYEDGAEEHVAALRQAIEARLKPCPCGGTFRFDAPRRCFSCHAPVIIEDPFGIDLYPNQDPFEPEESLDAERKKNLEAWYARFLPDLEDEWKSPSDPEP